MALFMSLWPFISNLKILSFSQLQIWHDFNWRCTQVINKGIFLKENSGSIPRNACRLQNIALESVTCDVWQTDNGQSDPYVSLCFAGDTKTEPSKRKQQHQILVLQSNLLKCGIRVTSSKSQVTCKKLWPRHNFFLSVHCDLYLSIMTEVKVMTLLLVIDNNFVNSYDPNPRCKWKSSKFRELWSPLLGPNCLGCNH